MVRTLPIAAVIVASVIAGCGASGGGGDPKLPPRELPVFRPGTTWPWTGGRAVQVAVDAGTSLRPITPLHFGMNTSWWSGKDWSLHPDRIAKARQLGAQLWRFPGGSDSDRYIWDGNYGPYAIASDGRDNTVTTQPEFLRTDDFITLLRELGAQPMVTANYGLARIGSVAEAADLAARWVRHFKVERDFPVRYWELGNEMYGAWETGHTVPGKPDLTGDVYGSDFRTMARAMKAVAPDIWVGAPALPQNWGPPFSDWTPAMLPEIQDDADFLVVHEYFNTAPLSNELTFAGLAAIRQNIETLDAMTTQYTARTTPFPVALTEFNVVLEGAPTVQLINGIVTGEIIGEAIASGYFALTYWDWKNEWNATAGGDHGMIAFKDPAVADDTPRPSYYGFAVFTRAAGDHTIEAQSSDGRVKVYASRWGAAGPLALVIANEHEEPVALTLDIAGFDARRWNAWVLTGANLNATSVTFNGVAGPAGGGGPFPIDDIPPYAGEAGATGAAAPITVPAASLTGIVLF